MLTNKVKREIDARLDRIVNENETFTKYLLAEDDEYIEEKLSAEYGLWYRVAQIQYEIERNFGRIVCCNTGTAERRRKRATLKAELLAEEESLYKKAVEAIKDYDEFYECA